MTESKHTPGPWKAGPLEGHVFDNIGTLIAGCMGHSRNFNDDTLRDQQKANAHLIAAAPDYHEGVVEALTPNDGYNCEYVSIPVKAWRMILAAHAKAEGR